MNITNRFRLLNRISSFCNNNQPSFSLFQQKLIHTTVCLSFHEPDAKHEDKTPLYQHFRNGLGLLKKEIKLWKKEVVETLENDPLMIVPGSIDKVWTFEDAGKLDNWVVTNDSDHNDGYSSSELTINEYGKAVFKGVLNTELPTDGVLKRAGFCNIRSITPQKSFQRDDCLNWGPYTHLVFRVRGDGRPYLINLSTPGYYDVLWNDIFQYVLHTRGGPYWQIAKIPFSKFVLSSKGKLQDIQHAVPLELVTNLGLTICDKIDGPFQLEIDYIAVEYDPDHTEEFAYEMYKLPMNIANS